MQNILNDKEYIKLINNIIKNKEFLKTKEILHHGITRYDHSLRVSYESYKLAKKYNLKYKEVARAGLLHDFFFEKESKFNDKIKTLFYHPLTASKNSNKYFKISDIEKNIIEAHMFPASLRFPKHKESWLVSFIDKKVAVLEFAKKFKLELSYITNLYFLYLVNSLA